MDIARILKYISQFFNIMDEGVNLFLADFLKFSEQRFLRSPLLVKRSERHEQWTYHQAEA